MKVTRLSTTLVLVLLMCLVLASTMSATDSIPPPPNPPDEGGGRRRGLPREPRCNLPGVVENDSSRTILIAADTVTSGGEWVYFWLPPGKVSDKHFEDLCDADWMMLEHEDYYWRNSFSSTGLVLHISAGYWAPYLFNITWNCYDHSGYKNKMYCYPREENWGRRR